MIRKSDLCRVVIASVIGVLLRQQELVQFAIILASALGPVVGGGGGA